MPERLGIQLQPREEVLVFVSAERIAVLDLHQFGDRVLTVADNPSRDPHACGNELLIDHQQPEIVAG
jgi:hypothetical protein